MSGSCPGISTEASLFAELVVKPSARACSLTKGARAAWPGPHQHLGAHRQPLLPAWAAATAASSCSHTCLRPPGPPRPCPRPWGSSSVWSGLSLCLHLAECYPLPKAQSSHLVPLKLPCSLFPGNGVTTVHFQGKFWHDRDRATGACPAF